LIQAVSFETTRAGRSSSISKCDFCGTKFAPIVLIWRQHKIQLNREIAFVQSGKRKPRPSRHAKIWAKKASADSIVKIAADIPRYYVRKIAPEKYFADCSIMQNN